MSESKVETQKATEKEPVANVAIGLGIVETLNSKLEKILQLKKECARLCADFLTLNAGYPTKGLLTISRLLANAAEDLEKSTEEVEKITDKILETNISDFVEKIRSSMKENPDSFSQWIVAIERDIQKKAVSQEEFHGTLSLSEKDNIWAHIPSKEEWDKAKNSTQNFSPAGAQQPTQTDKLKNKFDYTEKLKWKNLGLQTTKRKESQSTEEKEEQEDAWV